MAVQAHIEDIGEREAPHRMGHIQQRKGNKSQHMTGSTQQQWDEREDPEKSLEILYKIEDVQESRFTQEPELLKALVPIQTMHQTIFVAHLKTEDVIKRAISALEHSKAEVQGLLQRQLFCMTFHGTGQFNNKVIYVKMSADEQHILSKIAGMVLNSFMEMNIDVSSSRDFKPHLTFLKLSKAPAQRRKFLLPEY
ncbi:hypothetical protein E2320_011254 [Naja naja]|nr:hypothetical protein E2320_011254 [Naja naja]